MDELPRDLSNIIESYIPDIEIDNVGYSQIQVKYDMLKDAKTIHFYRTYELRDGVHLPNCEQVSGVPTIVATSLELLFRNSKIGNSPDLALWDVSNVYDMSYMFYGATLFNSDLGGWNVASVRSMSGMFLCAKTFNSDLSLWNVARVRSISWMFGEAKSFNCDLGDWDVANVQNISYMFFGAMSFNHDLSRWNVSNVQCMYGIFKGATNAIIPQWYH